ncbi:relaxase/mobilization nuclease domain-containing protein [Butyrivibrio sp. INlla14]|uniref:relaxase/mobilization nuclease domain-containing protein n=1 Tax=Butyrivibrio sp. INlla14 TaxID=1520808 RepID=UPI00087674C6|nr:relaxase/mobilization nuclease domain-containing protein [Butyrivibrio sp. INlla14]SCY63124.1 Relaxase/Mobilisation nuclease domain-containing protein [Butyrivibrio sp. INlla14]
MAATKLISMHQKKGQSIAKSLKDRCDYAKNKEKTEMGQYISSYACNVKLVDKEFAQSKVEYYNLTGREYKGDIIAWQIRQSFKPGEITPEEANKVGYETAIRFTKGNHAFIVATHTDRAHIHNHIIFNSTTLSCDRKFKDSWFCGLALQKVSDIVCLEHGLSIIEPKLPSERVKRTEYPEHMSYRDQIRKTINECFMQKPKTYDEFIRMMQQAGYDIKFGKHLAVKSKEQERYIRFRSLGAGYTEEDIKKHFEIDEPKKERDFDLLIDIQKKLQQGKGKYYERWAKVFNVKQVAKALLFLQEHDVRDYETLEKMTSDAATRFNELSNHIKAAESRMKEIETLRNHIFNYSDTRDIYVAYCKSGYSQRFYEAHRREITLHKAAKEAFSMLPGRIPKVKDLNEEYQELLTEKREAYSQYRDAKQHMQDFQIAKRDIDLILGLDEKKIKVKKLEKEL